VLSILDHERDQDPGPLDQVTVTLKELLQIEHCPRAWRWSTISTQQSVC